MECTWDPALLRCGDSLPPELLQIVAQSDDPAVYLQAITNTSLDPKYTYLLFAHCEEIFAHVCATLRLHGSLASAIATLGRIVPFAPYLQPHAQQLLAFESYNLSPSDGSEEDLLYLLGLFRLFAFEPRNYKKYIKPDEIASLLQSTNRPIVYLAIRILQIYLNGADHWYEEMLKRHLGEDTPEGGINGQWDDKIIDYRFLTLWEEHRFETVLKLVETTRANLVVSNVNRDQPLESISASTIAMNGEPPATSTRCIPVQYFSASIVYISGILLPGSTTQSSSPAYNNLVQTTTTRINLRNTASALRLSRPLLLTGLSGAGKSTIARHVAGKLGYLDKLVTLHLNEQSDAKMLLGIHTTGDTPGSFVWKAGVLTTAVKEGRWILIEDLDRAPNEIIGTLLPLIEKGELLIPSRKETIHAAPGFRLIATVRSTIDHRGEETAPLINMLGARHWQRVSVKMPPTQEWKEIAMQLYPSLVQLLPQFLTVYDRVKSFRQRGAYMGQSKTGVLRSISPQDFLRWCNRVAGTLREEHKFTSADIDGIFVEAVDCFVGALPDCPLRTEVAAVIAEELRIDPQRRNYLLTDREIRYELDKARIRVGRYNLPRANITKKLSSSQAFSTNPHTTRMLERVAAAVTSREPLLLVGETGVGKTTAVQHLATHLGKHLVAFNLSQQSEGGDLLGGFKPVSARSLIVPLKDEFDELFSASFSLKKNQQFLELLGKQMSKGNWKSVCKIWGEALKMVEQQRTAPSSRLGEAPSKKRKLESKHVNFGRWEAFASRVSEIERLLAAGSQAFAFSFVEGRIVQAVRNGDWVLLDEINLASPDTLESIADLFESRSPSVLLAEAGDIERIDAHPDFRIFAAMNPATDVGKKDLPPGIRSRFTELFVESPDKDLESLQSIVRSYLRHEAATDQSIALDTSVLYQKIIQLAEQNKLVDGAGQRPHFSLRTLTRTLSFAKHISSLCSLRRALYEGFQMSFLTFLDADSSSIVQPLLELHLFGKRTNVKAEMQKPLRKPNDGNQYLQGYPGSKHWVRQGNFEVEEQPHYILTPFIRSNLENLVRAASTRQFPVLLQGPTSSGKTSMIEYLAKRTGHKFVRINNHEHTDLQEYLGTYISDVEGRLYFQEGILVKAIREGHWIVLDELNLAPTDVLEALNRLLDDNRELLVPETQEVVRPHEDFMLFATQNPAGLYGGRKALSRAFRNRFLELHFDDIPVDELQEILHKRTSLPESRCKRIVQIYRELSVLRQEMRLFEQRSFATLRDLFRWAFRPNNDLMQELAVNGFMLLGERVRKAEERQMLKNVLQKVVSSNNAGVIDEDNLYSRSCKEIMHYDSQSKDSSVVWTKAMRRLYVLVSRAIENNEPVLLVGDTGCGKTTVCQMLARAFGKELYTVNAHQNTETGDLIGSQRPVRNRAVIEANLRHQLLSTRLLQSLDTAAAYSTDALLDAYDRALALLEPSQKRSHCKSADHVEIQSLRTRYKALFEWNDGALVQAMKAGDFFLLDEISLADDSVLERINSVLEQQRSVLLAEKGSLESYVVAAQGFQFFATMNPGGDYGKRELSPALRNRFTEIWVPPLDDAEDIREIITANLIDIAKPYAQAMVEFAQWFKERYNTSASSSISIRDALAWANFTNLIASRGSAQALVHGAAMVYIDTLGANPAGLMNTTQSNIDQERATCLRELSKLLSFDAEQIYSSPVHAEFNGSSLFVGLFAISGKISTMPPELSFSFRPQTTRNNAMRVVRALQLPKPVMLEGSPGVGKTALIVAIAKAVSKPLTRINLSEQTDLIDLFGSDVPVEGVEVGTFAWRDAPFLRAMKNGEWVLLDEMNLASQSVLEGLNACLDHRGEVFVPELGQTFKRHSDFRLFAAQNPHHQGGGRKGLPASFVNRFTVVFADAFRSDDLLSICLETYPILERTLVQKAVQFVDQLNHEVTHNLRLGADGRPWEFNLRDLNRWLYLASSDDSLLKSATSRDFVDFLFSQRFRSASDKAFVRALFSRCFDDARNASDLFPSISSQALQVGIALVSRAPGQAEHMRIRPEERHSGTSPHAVQSVMLCLQQNWPVILSGSAGSGKTAHIEHLAAVVGAPVVTVAMNAETDVMDLLGGYEQADTHRHSHVLSDGLRARLESITRDQVVGFPDTDVIKILYTLKQGNLGMMNASDIDQITALLSDGEVKAAKKTLEEIQKPTTSLQRARFEWIDGLLIDCLIEGKWLVLDNANLCSPSVLDRLNSLLEPGGVLIVNEHNDQDGLPRIIRPHPNFRIFITIDPKYGELSRAMRNRAVEIHLSDQPTERPRNGKFLPFRESSLARFRQVKVLNTLSPQHESHRNLLSIVQDHLGVEDEPLVVRFEHQLRNGLYNVDCGELDVALSSLSGLLRVCGENTKNFYQSCSRRLQVTADFASVQTLYPLNNQALVQSSQHTLSEALSLAFAHDVAVNLASVANAVTTIEPDRAAVSKIRNVERSLGLRHPSRQIQSNQSIVITVIKVLINDLFESIPKITSAASQGLHEIKCVLGEINAFFMTLLDAVKSSALDMTYLIAMLSFTRNLVQPRDVYLPPTLTSYLAQMQRDLGSIGVSPGNFRGRACVGLWKALKPTVPATQEKLNDVLRFEAALDKFDRSCQRFDHSVESMADLRISIARTLQLAREDEHGSGLESLTQMFENLPPPSQDSQSLKARRPHFYSVFRSLYERFAILKFGNTDMPQEMDLVKLCIFSMRPSKDSADLSPNSSLNLIRDQLTLLGSVAGILIEDSKEVASNTRLVGNLLQRLNTTREITLSHLDLLKTECQTLGAVVASQAHLLAVDETKSLDVFLERLLRTTLEALAGLTDAPQIQRLASQLAALLDKGPDDPTITDVARALKNLTITPTSPESLLFSKLHQVVLYCRKPLIFHDTAVISAAQAWAVVAYAGLQLYISEVPFDPALESHLRRDTYRRQNHNLSSRLDAVRTFRGVMTGVVDCLRVKFLEADLLALGPEPTYEAVYRPPISQLAELQPEFEALMRTLQPIWENDSSAASGSLLDRTSLNNIIRVRTRLTTEYRPYDDFTSPIVGFIDCLLVAQRLITQSSDVAQTSPIRPVLSSLVPFVGATFNDWLRDDSFTIAHSPVHSPTTGILWLSVLATRSAIWPISESSVYLRNAIQERFQRIYVRWRSNLEEEQRSAAAKSSLYKYKAQADDDEPTLDEIEEYFPTGDSESVDNKSEKTSETADVIASLHRAVFLPSALNHRHISELVHQLQKTPTTEGFSCEDEDALPAILRSIGDLSNGLSMQTTTDPTYDIYRHANIAEAQALHDLLKKTESHFLRLHQVWPEHATPVDVLVQCENISELRHTTPLSHFLPKVEKLHSIVHEWQKITSREYNANEIQEELVSLIIRWRQAELSTWAKLMDHEWKECEKDASSWWYIAYEVIIVASIRTEKAPKELQHHAKGLIKTLGDFLTSSRLGEFGAKLRMLRAFEAHLALSALDSPPLGLIRSALLNLVRYYARFELKVDEALSRGRNNLEREFRTVIQLASWKDRNIDVLKQSAQSSRRRLLRLVRKYRALLAQPILPIIEDEFPQPNSVQRVGHMNNSVENTLISISSSGLSSLSIWNDRPDRYRNVSATANLILTKAGRAQSKFDAAERIESFATELQRSILELRKETPLVLSKNNEAFVNHLKNRKRRLLADVLRDLRSMGFRVGMNQRALEQQASNSDILAHVPNLSDPTETVRADEAEYEFHRLLSYVPKARSAAIKPSDDVTAAEIGRCTSLLESVLELSAMQYCSLSSQLTKTTQLNQTLKQLRNFVTCDISAAATLDSRAKHIQAARINCLPVMLAFAVDTLRTQQELAGENYGELLQVLEAKLNGLQEIQIEAKSAPVLPANIHSSREVAIESRFFALVNEIQSASQSGIAAHPELRAVLSQLMRWLDAGDSCISQPRDLTDVVANNGLSAWAQDMFKTLDFILGSIQDLETKNETRLQKADGNAWLIMQYRALNTMFEALDVQRIERNLLDVVSQIQHLHTAQNESLISAAAVCQVLFPILNAYHETVNKAVKLSCELFVQVTRTGSSLAKGFMQLATHGFCSPSEKSEGSSKQESSLEEGTGLGDGEGAEDISKDIGDDEDLSELAKQNERDSQRDEVEDEKDAVDMADAEVEGETGADDPASGEDNDDQDGEMEDADEMQQELGEGDADGPSAVDEKMWDDAQEENQRIKEAESGGKNTDDDKLAAATDAKDRSQTELDEDDHTGQDDAGIDMEELEHRSPEKLDPHIDQEQNLELPEDITFDGKPQTDEDSDNESLHAEHLEEPESAETAEIPDDAPLEQTKDNGIDEQESSDADNRAANDPEEESSNQSINDAESDILMHDTEMADSHDAMNDFTTPGTGEKPNLDEANVDQAREPPSQRHNGNDAGLDTSDKPEQEDGSGGQNSTSNIDTKPPSEPSQDSKSTSFKQLGDALKQWYDQHQKIQEPQTPKDEHGASQEGLDMADAQFQHLPDADAVEDAQALGAASKDQVTALNKDNALQVNEQEHDTRDMFEDYREVESNDDNENSLPHDDRKMESEDDLRQIDQVGSFIGKSAIKNDDVEMADGSSSSDVETNDSIDEEHGKTLDDGMDEMTLEEARTSWSQHEERTRNLALTLTEHLRLILQPTQATKLRGDFRTGKRLNIKRIIPYIASSYKRDKIWMRRSVPSKRSYQVMLAIDDSKSMTENQSRDLAFETLALVARSMSMLEVGELSVVGFGSDVKIAHDFSSHFTSETGSNTLQHFSFAQNKTDVRNLLAESIKLFQAARLKATGSSSDLWQLQLIISDGICEDHPAIRQLVRQAQEERIMVVFIIVDSAPNQSQSAGESKQSILDLQTAEFVKDDAGEPRVKMLKYLDTFPFQYYLIVRDVRELPTVLAGALRQWFAEVVDVNS